MYGKWIESKPFDIGNTTRNALFKAHSEKPLPDLVTKAAANKIGSKSESNGCLMRIAPMAIWGYKLS